MTDQINPGTALAIALYNCGIADIHPSKAQTILAALAAAGFAVVPVVATEEIQVLTDDLRRYELQARNDLDFAQKADEPAKTAYFTGLIIAFEDARKRVASIEAMLAAARRG